MPASIDEMIAADDRVVVRWTLHATHTGPFVGIAPTQKKIAGRGISLYRLRDGKITETRNQADLLGMFSPLGAIEKPKVAA
jgi:predicted ester cyclase